MKKWILFILLILAYKSNGQVLQEYTKVDSVYCYFSRTQLDVEYMGDNPRKNYLLVYQGEAPTETVYIATVVSYKPLKHYRYMDTKLLMKVSVSDIATAEVDYTELDSVYRWIDNTTTKLLPKQKRWTFNK